MGEGRFTKGEVNRAGRLALDFRERVFSDGAQQAEAAFDLDKLEEAWHALTWWRSLHARPLTTVAANLRYHVDRAGGRIEGRIEVAQRLKRLPTLIEKLGRQPGDVTQMHDIGGVRAVLPTQGHVYLVRRRLLKSWTPLLRERDYIERPKESGYRAVHLIFRRHGYAIEVQLRTPGQDVWANAVERWGRQAGVDLKSGRGGPRDIAFLGNMAELIAAVERSDISAENLSTGLDWMSSIVEEESDEPDR